ncbi:hypothetical protein LQ772_15330 [Frateuria edaphi]|uniref:hypothetical protein n=1 Tax=Frateuria edaphi TaxID=2898793 RepID=UPI001E461F42|nr:hypothetical protein [Frateuria edaphi]UGB45333.1 hypothetical protein LQ772_15330 [Frateuria edaphi]
MTRLRVPCVVLFAAWMLPAIALAGSTATDAVTAAPAWHWPTRPITSRAQLDAYLHDTPTAASPLSVFTQVGLRRFLASLAFNDKRLVTFSTDDLRYDLTREQAWDVLRLFGKESYAIGLGARTRERPGKTPERHALEGAYDRLAKALQVDPGGTSLASIYAEDFAPAQARLASLDDRDLELLFRATGILASTHPQSTAYLAALERDFALLERREQVDRPYAETLHGALLIAHRPDEARALVASHAGLDLQPPPTMRSAARIRTGRPSVWIVGGAHELWRLPLMLHDTVQIVIFGSPNCRYSQNAARDIEADPALRRLFRAHAQWVAPARNIVDFGTMQSWNRDHPAQKLAILQDDDELPYVASMRTPVFYILRRGQLAATLEGWPGPDQRDALRRHLVAVGLLPPPQEAR